MRIINLILVKVFCVGHLKFGFFFFVPSVKIRDQRGITMSFSVERNLCEQVLFVVTMMSYSVSQMNYRKKAFFSFCLFKKGSGTLYVLISYLA